MFIVYSLSLLFFFSIKKNKNKTLVSSSANQDVWVTRMLLGRQERKYVGLFTEVISGLASIAASICLGGPLVMNRSPFNTGLNKPIQWGLAQGVRGPLYIELCIKSKKERDESEQPFITPNSELFLFFF